MSIENFVTFMSEDNFLRKKTLHFLKGLPYKNGQAKIMPVVAGRFVLISFPMSTICLFPVLKKLMVLFEINLFFTKKATFPIN